jgi:hypothetical protein
VSKTNWSVHSASVVDNAADRVKWARQQATAAGDQETLRALADAEKLPATQRAMSELGASGKYRLSPPGRLYAKTLYSFMRRGTSNAGMSDAARFLGRARHAVQRRLQRAPRGSSVHAHIIHDASRVAKAATPTPPAARGYGTSVQFLQIG